MQSARKVTLVPAKIIQKGAGFEESDANEGSLSTNVEKSPDKIKSKIYDKIHRFIKVILKLARSVGYDENLRIKLKNGKFLEKSNIVDLLTHAMSVGKVLYGENEFIELLADSDVDPNLIINDNVRLKLIQFQKPSKEYKEIVEQPSQRIIKSVTNESPIIKENIKIVKKGPKKYITVNEDGATINLSPIKDKKMKKFNKNYITVDRNGGTIELDQPEPNTIQSAPERSLKRKISEVEEEDDDTIDDSDIDPTRWKIN